MGRGNPCGPPALVILMAATMPATAGTGQAAITALVRVPPIQVGRSVHLDRALLIPQMQSRRPEHDEPQSSSR